MHVFGCDMHTAATYIAQRLDAEAATIAVAEY